MDKDVLTFNLFLSIFGQLKHAGSAVEETKNVMTELFPHVGQAKNIIDEVPF